MTSQTKPQRPALPPVAVDRLFARFLAIYGAQKFASAWGNVDVVERNATWSDALGRFDLAVIGEAVRDLAEHGSGWPPSCGEFVDRCERFDQRPGRRIALPVPRRTEAEIAAGREQMDRIKSMLRGSVRAMDVAP